jgi:hypothetical protein
MIRAKRGITEVDETVKYVEGKGVEIVAPVVEALPKEEEEKPIDPRFRPRGGSRVPAKADAEAGARVCRVYGSVINPRLRLIEFPSGQKGRMWVRRDELFMGNWVVWVVVDPDHPNDWKLHGRYNERGIRTA